MKNWLIKIWNQPDKLKHIIYAAFIFLSIKMIFAWAGFSISLIIGFIIAVLAVMFKDIVWDLWLGKGQYEEDDIFAGYLSIAVTSLIIIFDKLLAYI